MGVWDGSVLTILGVGLPVAAIATLALTPLVIRAARRFDWVEHPTADRWHGTPTALMGGIALYGGATLAAVLVVPLRMLGPIWGGATLLFVLGAVDDRHGVPPAAKLTAQVAATGGLLYAGYSFGAGWPLWLSLPLTLLWVIGITNAVNLLDNMDGLAAGVAGIAALVMAGFGALSGSALAAALGASVAGAAAGFLWFNFKPARIFMGDCGSLFLGYTIAALALVMQRQATGVGEIAVALVPLAVLAVPILDTTLVTFVRKLSGRPVMEGGRDHTSHRLVFLGLSEIHAVLMLYGVSLASGGLALAVLFVDETLFYALAALAAVALGVFGVHLARAGEAHRDTAGGDGRPARRPRPFRVLHRLFGHRWKAGVGVLGDAVLIAAAFVVAYHLRFGGALPLAARAHLAAALPVVVTAKLMVFYAMGLYRGIWRHAGTPELVRTGTATLLGGGAAAAVLAGLRGPEAVSVAVLVTDWMVLTLAVVGARFGFRGLRQYLAANRSRGRQVLLYGAGDAGVLTLRELRRNPALGRTPVGFLDDDPQKQHRTVKGVPVLGTGDDLVQICREHDVHEVVVTTTLPAPRRRTVARRCRDADIACTRFDVGFESLEPEPETERQAAGPPVS